MSKARVIVVDDVEYKYRVGRENIRFTRPDGTSKAVNLSTLTGLNWTEIERAKRKEVFKVTPADIAEWIKDPSHDIK